VWEVRSLLVRGKVRGLEVVSLGFGRRNLMSSLIN
jgi:hypothetical protein